MRDALVSVSIDPRPCSADAITTSFFGRITGSRLIHGFVRFSNMSHEGDCEGVDA